MCEVYRIGLSGKMLSFAIPRIANMFGIPGGGSDEKQTSFVMSLSTTGRNG